MSILNNLKLTSRINQQWTESGLDSLAHCNDREYFLKYPYPISYQYNSRGFRDHEWPANLEEPIWCIGDSFTVGLGSPFSHCWPQILQSASQRRTINVSMDGASNEWISRVACDIIKQVSPKNIVIMWSYAHRREDPDYTLDDEQRRNFYTRTTAQEDLENFKSCIERLPNDTNIVHTVIPRSQEFYDLALTWENIRGPDWPEDCPTTELEYTSLPKFVLSEIYHMPEVSQQIKDMLRNKHEFELLKKQYDIIEVESLDVARDGHHFDILTSQWLVQQVLPRLV